MKEIQIVEFEQPEEDNSSREKEKKRNRKIPFTKEEDNLILELVQKYGSNNWDTVTKYVPGRQKRQVKERYRFYLSNTFQNIEWTEEDDKKLLELSAQKGTKWNYIAKELGNRSPTNCKNRQKQLIRLAIRQMRQVNRKESQNKLSPEMISLAINADLQLTQHQPHKNN